MTNKGSGNLIFIEWDSGVLIGLTDKSFSAEADMLDITDQQSTESWKEYTPGEKGATLNFSGLYAEDAGEGATTLYDDLAAGTKVSFKIGERPTGRRHWAGYGYVKTVDVNGPKNDPMSYSGTIQVTGKPSVASTTW